MPTRFDQAFLDIGRNVHPRIPPRLSLPAINFHLAGWNGDQDSKAIKKSLLDLFLSLINRGIDTDGNDQKSVTIMNINGAPAEPKTESAESETEPAEPKTAPAESEAEPAEPKTESIPPKAFKFLGMDIGLNEGRYSKINDADVIQSFTDVETFTLWLKYYNNPIRIFCSVHSEYFTLTFWLPFTISMTANEERRKICDGGQDLRKNLYPIWKKLIESQPTDPALIKQLENMDWKSEIDIKAGCTYLYDKYLDDLQDDLLGNHLSSYDFFADFRSIIVSSELSMNGDFEVPSKPAIAYPERTLAAMSTIFNLTNDARPELMGSLFLNKRVAYLSSLGSSTARSLETQLDSLVRLTPVRYLMYANQVSRWQMGRLIERLNLLGTYRLAALRDLAKLNTASHQLIEIGDGLDRDVKSFETGALDEEKVYKWQRKFDKIATDVALQNGVAYRVERSRFYVSAFQSLVEDLRTDRIIGYQSYPDFIRRRFSATWDRIDRIGIRHERLARRLDFLANQLILTGQTRQTRALIHTARSQVGLLSTAEVIAVFPISYYLSGTVAAFLDMRFGFKDFDHSPTSFTVSCFLYSVFLLKISTTEKKRLLSPDSQNEFIEQKDIDEAKKKIKLWSVAAYLFLLAAILFFYGTILQSRTVVSKGNPETTSANQPSVDHGRKH
jgi:hypothetical protein